MEIIGVEVFITKQYMFKKNDVNYSCLVEIKNNQIANIFITASNGLNVDQNITEEIKNLISI